MLPPQPERAVPRAPRPLILGHRGAPRGAPENTLRAFRLALEEGADGVELDVQPSADGVPVVLHDDTLDRTTDATGDVATLSWARISEAAAVEVIARAGLRGRTVFSSFSTASVAEVRRLDPEATCYFLSEGRAGL